MLNAYTPRHDFNPMDCTDIVIGMARDKLSRIWDYYTRDRSTPRFDTFWGGKNDLTAAMGFEKDGVTTILFRKRLIAQEPTDHSIEKDLMHVIWARGQEIGHYNHFPKSGLEVDRASVKDFYKPDELKYHGHGDQRGFLALNFYGKTSSEARILPKRSFLFPAIILDEKKVEVSNPDEPRFCGSSWKVPKTCNPKKHDCEYYAKWEYLSRKDEIKFTIETTHVDRWTGIAFSDDPRMVKIEALSEKWSLRR